MWAKNEDFRGGQSYPGGATLAAQSKNWFVARSHAIFPFDIIIFFDLDILPYFGYWKLEFW